MRDWMIFVGVLVLLAVIYRQASLVKCAECGRRVRSVTHHLEHPPRCASCNLRHL